MEAYGGPSKEVDDKRKCKSTQRHASILKERMQKDFQNYAIIPIRHKTPKTDCRRKSMKNSERGKTVQNRRELPHIKENFNTIDPGFINNNNSKIEKKHITSKYNTIETSNHELKTITNVNLLYNAKP